MTTKVNILIDGGFFAQKFKERTTRFPFANDIEAEVGQIMTALQKKTNGVTNDILIRVYYYDCRPYGGVETKPGDATPTDYSQSSSYRVKERVLHELGLKEQFAIRLGELSFDGWNSKQTVDDATGTVITEYFPIFHQKGVDIKVGLDMAWMALKHTCDKIILVAGDSDFIAPIKFVRKEGLQVYLYAMGHNVKAKMIEHCDFILS